MEAVRIARPVARPARSSTSSSDPTRTFERTAAQRRILAHASVASASREWAVVSGITLLTVLTEWPFLNGRVVAGLDSLTQFYPWYELLGATLRDGRLPGWNPYSLAGTPLAANPLSGWTYLPAMLAFTFLPFSAAVVAYQLFHVLLATLGSYALARALGLRLVGAVLAGVAYGQSGLIAGESACCFAFVSVGAWLPLLLVGAELAVRADRLTGQVRGWSLAALALSQILASWLGQGSYYALLVFGSFVAYRVLTTSVGSCLPETASVRTLWVIWRLRRLALHVTLPILLGAGLAAAGLLPRIELNALSSLAGGYGAEDQHVGGWSVWEWAQLGEPGYWYAGSIVIGLATSGVWLARRWPPAVYLVALGGTVLLLALPGPNPVHDLFGWLPGFSRLHPHLPDRVVTVVMLVPALLAGAAVDRLARSSRVGLLVTILLVGAAFADLRAARERMFEGYAAAEGVHRLYAVDLAV